MAQAPILAVLGATSQIARDFVPLFRGKADLQLFARSGEARPYHEFPSGTYDAVINFVGVGDPSRAREMGADIVSITRRYDEMALEYQLRHPGTRYIFLSSGAAYGGDFLQPARDNGEKKITPDEPEHYYGAAKQEAEQRHRSLSDQTIFDLRVFSYVSRSMDLSARFLLAEMIRCVRDSSPFSTIDRPMTRDFLHPADFAQLVTCCLEANGNMALDCYSRSPITKHELLELMASRFGMTYVITPSPAETNSTGEKPQYYSESRHAALLGYNPSHSSHSAITAEASAILVGN